MLARGSRLVDLPNTNQIDSFLNKDLADKNFNQSVGVHSRTITLIKISLPLIAGVLGLTLLFFPTLKKDLNEIAIDLVIPDGDIEKMTAENTSLYITDAKGRVNNFVAQTIKETSSGSQIYDILKPEVSFPLNNDEWINIRSANGIYDQQKGSLQLPHKVEFFYSQGFNIDARNFFYDFKKSSGYSNHPVVGYGFLGHLNSEGLQVYTDQQTLIFKGKTTIIIDESSLKKETD